MWNPVRIHFENLFSHRNSTYEFVNNKCVVIFGKNKTDKSLDNNGAGKTTLFEAVSLALTNDSLRGVKKESFINRDADECVIVFDLTNKTINKTLRIVRRYFRGNKAVQVEIWENNVRNTQIVSVLEANKRIIELLGISREDLLRYFIISQDNHYTFFTASDSEKKEVMNRITSADVLNPVLEELNGRLKERENDRDAIEYDIENITQRQHTLEEQLSDILNDDSSKYQIEEIEEKIRDEKSDITRYKYSLAQDELERKDIELKIKAITIADTDELYRRRKTVKGKIDNVEENISENKRVVRKMTGELDKKQTCPKCGEVFIAESEFKLTVAEVEDLIQQANKEITKYTKQLDKLTVELQQVNTDISNNEAQQRQLSVLNNKKDSIERRIKNVKESITVSDKRIERWQAEITELRNNTERNKIVKDIEAKIKDCITKVDAKTKELNPVAEEVEMMKFWQFNLGRSGFMTYLANRSVKIIEGITNSYLRKFGVDISVMINGFKVLKSGEVREKIDVFVTNDGITAESFMAKSGGERARIVLAGILGIQHLINLSTNGLGLNLLVLDEALSGIDSNGTMEVIKTIDQLGSTVLMITQNIEDASICSNYIEVVKENGVSSYVKK